MEDNFWWKRTFDGWWFLMVHDKVQCKVRCKARYKPRQNALWLKLKMRVLKYYQWVSQIIEYRAAALQLKKGME